MGASRHMRSRVASARAALPSAAGPRLIVGELVQRAQQRAAPPVLRALHHVVAAAESVLGAAHGRQAPARVGQRLPLASVGSTWTLARSVIWSCGAAPCRQRRSLVL